MYKEIILLLFIGHFLGDYYFQSDQSVQNQNQKTVHLHSLIYTFSLFLTTLPVMNQSVFVVVFVLSFSHWLIDSIKYYYKATHELSYDQLVFVYLFDQFLHLMVILLGGTFLILRQIDVRYLSGLENILLQLQLNSELILSWILVLLVIYKPSSISIRIILDHFEPKHKKEEDEGISNAGALIGIFERLIILLMIYAGQLPAIGFVLTAKSVARYNKISEDPQFAEYYLLGTLLSSLFIMISFYLIF